MFDRLKLAYAALKGAGTSFRAVYAHGGLFIETSRLSAERDVPSGGILRTGTLVIPFGTPFVIHDDGLCVGVGQTGGNILFPFFDVTERAAVVKALSGSAPARVKRKMVASFAAGVFALAIGAGIAGSDDAPDRGDQPAVSGGPTIGPEALLNNSILFGAKDAAPEKTLYVFTDPQCPYCKDYERTLSSLGPQWQVRILPVGFKPNSEQMSDAALCSKDPAKAWKYTIQGGQIDEVAPTTCALSSRENMETFSALGMTSTPSTLRGDGKLFEGAVSKAELESPAQ